ncbi:MAG TPA: preprotein translocase subunit SecG [Candidatus Bathyarchaeia archaeon]|nr:preprotein translocase subunit SecG [Candidatus Bathyarchaeia archaeon]
MKQGLIIFQLVISLGLIGLVLLQSKDSGLGSSFGGAESYHSKKGIERIVYVGTIIFAALFLTTSLINAFLL